MNGRQIDDIEAHIGRVLQAGFAVLQASMPARRRRTRAREELIPCGIACPRRIDHDFQLALEPQHQIQVRVACRDCIRCVVQCHTFASFDRIVGAQACCPRSQSIRIRAGGTRCRLLDQHRALQQRRGDVLHVHAARKLAPPRQQVIDPGIDRVTIAAEVLHREAGAETIVAERLHFERLPRLRIGVAVVNAAAYGVVTIGEQICFHHHRLPDHALDRKAAAIDLRRDVLDDHAHAPIDGDRVDLLGANGLTPSAH